MRRRSATRRLQSSWPPPRPSDYGFPHDIYARRSPVEPLCSGSREDSLGLLLSTEPSSPPRLTRYREKAAIHEFSRIDIATQPRIGTLAAQISWMWSEYQLASRQLFIAKLSGTGKVLLESIE
jgi:hypothetical protein